MEKTGITIEYHYFSSAPVLFSAEIDELARYLGYTDIVFLDDKFQVTKGTMQDIGRSYSEQRMSYRSVLFYMNN